MSGSRELLADWKGERCEREMEAGGKSLSSAGTGAPVPWTGGAVLANIQPSPCSTTSSTHKQRQSLKPLLPFAAIRLQPPRFRPVFFVSRKSG
ncbi:putative zinc finger protein AEBP2-like [Triplophysa rosa]|uniref:Zinc finger protein AEBP2-like n=1 Tax=Triplophysa rosa TaxID=992332 RepID=A0A9W7TTJ7_TRIRA|nr:putative zinc finger protein AEBP2-like [Triplophysa rosa]